MQPWSLHDCTSNAVSLFNPIYHPSPSTHLASSRAGQEQSGGYHPSLDRRVPADDRHPAPPIDRPCASSSGDPEDCTTAHIHVSIINIKVRFYDETLWDAVKDVTSATITGNVPC